VGAADNGNVLSITNCRDTNRTQNFTYDALNRIQTAYTSGPNWGESYGSTTAPGGIPTTKGIDAWGNLWQRSPITGKTNYEPLSVPALGNNRLTGFGYDVAGNMTSNGGATYTYDAENRLATAGGVTYTYDGDGNRVKKSSGTLYWGAGPLAESDLTASATSWKDYVFFNGKRLARRDASNSSVHYFFSDHLGSTSVTTNSTGATIEEDLDYLPYGGIASGTPSDHYLFTGKERDAESGLDNFGARLYASSLGRFMTPDWAGRPTAVPYAVFGDPQSLNLYGYVRNDPVSRADADGHQCGPATCAPNEEVAPVTTQVPSAKPPAPTPAQNHDGTVPVTVGQRPIRNWLAKIFSLGFAKHSYYIVLGHRFEVLGNPGSSHNQQVRETTGTTMDIRGKEHKIYVSPEQAQTLYNGSEYFAEHTGSGDMTSDYPHPCPTCTGGQEGYNFLLHNSNSFVYNIALNLRRLKFKHLYLDKV
jgi:RHS repeat-associated protein